LIVLGRLIYRDQLRRCAAPRPETGIRAGAGPPLCGAPGSGSRLQVALARSLQERMSAVRTAAFTNGEEMPSKKTVRSALYAATLASTLAIPRNAPAADISANRAAELNDREYTAGYLSSGSASQAVNADQKGCVTREEFAKFQEQLLERVDRGQSDEIGYQGTGAGASGKQAAPRE